MMTSNYLILCHLLLLLLSIFPSIRIFSCNVANAGYLRDTGSMPGSKDPLEEGIATHSSILSWRILWAEEPDGLQSMGLQKVGHDLSDLACMHAKLK